MTTMTRLMEMAKQAKICTKCGKSASQGHYWYKGGWKCKGSGEVADFGDGTASAVPSAADTAGTPADPATDTTAITGVADAPVQKVAAKKAPKKAAPADPAAPSTGTDDDVDYNDDGGFAEDDYSSPAVEHYMQRVRKWWRDEDNILMSEDANVTFNEQTRRVDVSSSVMVNAFAQAEFTDDNQRIFPVPLGVIEGEFMVFCGQYTSFRNMPKQVNGDFIFANMKEPALTGVDGLPEIVNGNMDISNSLTSLAGIHKVVKQINGTFTCTSDEEDHQVKSAVLGLLRIKGLTKVVMKPAAVEDIINKHLAGDRDPIAAQEELIDAGLTAYAKM